MPCDQQRNLELAAEKERKKQNERKEKARAVIRDQAKKMGWKLIETKPDKFVATKPYSTDRIEIDVMGDGVIKTTTDKISMANHVNAEGFLLNIARAMGGKWNIQHRHGKGAAHSHEHLHA